MGAPIRIATRGSALAMAQARLVVDLLVARHPGRQFVLEPMTTHGDRATAMPLAESEHEGVFVKDLERALLDGRAELAVHSAKDLPTAETDGLVIAAYPERADARDVLVSRGGGGLADLPRGARVGTGSPRRAAQLRQQRPDLRVETIRGNVDTRLRKLADGAVDALVLAAAGLERLGRTDVHAVLLEPAVMLPAPGQGALAVQARSGSEAAALAASIDELAVRRAVLAERAVLRGLGGGCLSAIGVLAQSVGDELELSAVVLANDGSRMIRSVARGRLDGTVIADVLAGLQHQGAARLLRPEGRSLSGLRIMVTRPVEQAGAFVHELQREGAIPVLCPVIAIQPLPVNREAVQRLDRYDWVIFTSANGVEQFLTLLDTRTLPPSLRLAAIGPETAARLQARGLNVEVIPARFIAEELADLFPAERVRGRRLLLPRAAGSRDVLPDRLRARGADVDVLELYRAVAPPSLAGRLRQCLRNGVDIITFASSSTVRHFMAALNGLPVPAETVIACIGPITAAAASEAGLRVDVVAEEYTTRGLLRALVRHRAEMAV